MYINNKKEDEINFHNLNDLIGRIKLLLFTERKAFHFIKLISNTNKSFESSSKNTSNSIRDINLDQFFKYEKPIEYEIIIGNELKDDEKWSVFELKSFS